MTSVIKEKNDKRKREGNRRLKKHNVSSLIEKNKEKGKILTLMEDQKQNGMGNKSEGRSPREIKAQSQ